MTIAVEGHKTRIASRFIGAGAKELGRSVVRGALLFPAATAFMAAGEFLTDAQVFTGKLPIAYATDLLKPIDFIVAGGLTALQLGGLAITDYVAYKGQQEHAAEVNQIYREGRNNRLQEKMYIQHGETLFKHGPNIATAALSVGWWALATGVAALALAQ